MRRSRRTSLAALTLALVVMTSVPAGALDEQTRNTARTLAENGAVAYETGEYERALELFRRAYVLVPAPTISIFEARCLAKLGLLIEASERYEDTRRAQLEPGAPAAFRQAVKDAEREAGEVRIRTPRIRIKLDGAQSATRPRVVLDGKALRPELVGGPISVNPGLHRIAASIPGEASGKATVVAQESQYHLVSVPLVPYSDGEDRARPTAAADPSAQKTWGIVLLGVGATGIAVGVTGAVMANGKRDELDERCNDNRCPASAERDLNSFRTARTISLVGYGVGALGLATGTALLLWPEQNRKERPIAIRPALGVGTVGATGQF